MHSPRQTHWAAPGRSRSPSRPRPARSSSADSRSCVLDRALRQYLRDLEFLELDDYAVGDFHAQELIAHLSHLADDSAGCCDLIAHRDLGEHFPLLFGALALRPDEQKIEHH